MSKRASQRNTPNGHKNRPSRIHPRVVWPLRQERSCFCESRPGRQPAPAQAGIIDLERAIEDPTVFRFESIAHPFAWKFGGADLNGLIGDMRSRYWQSQSLKPAARQYVCEVLKWTTEVRSRY